MKSVSGASVKPLTPAVLERVGRYMGLSRLHPASSADELWIQRTADSPVRPTFLRHLAADVLDKLISDGRQPNLWAQDPWMDCTYLPEGGGKVRASVRGGTWSEAVLLAAAAVQEARDGIA